MITPRDVARETMTEEKRKEAKNDLFSFYIGRPITYLLTIPFLYTKIKPNHITFLSILFSIAGFILCFFARDNILLTIAWLMFFLWSLFDGVDGNIARYKKQFSKLGTVYDTMGGYIAIIFMFFGAGIAAYFNKSFVDNYVTYDKIYIIIVGALSSIFDIFPRLMMHNISSTLKDETSMDVVRDKSEYGFIKKLILNITSPSGGIMVAFIVAIWIKSLDIFTVGYCLLNFLKMIATLFIMFNRVKKGENI